jgi:phosphatidylethanolamine/phosphatidyl-N-methylethanolamine N-methyltransferase
VHICQDKTEIDLKTALLKEFILKPVTVGTIWPSSKSLCQEMVSGVDIENAKLIVELGPGTGPITRYILEHKSPDAHLIAIELSRTLCEKLTATMPEAEFINASAEELPALLKERNQPQADLIVSGLPWAAFSSDLQHRILDQAVTSLRPGGYFTTFAYIQGRLLPSYHRFRKLLESEFDEVTLSPIVWKNVPPAFVYRCRHNGIGKN